MSENVTESGTTALCSAGFQLYSAEDAANLFRGRDIYIWGAGQKGRGFKLALERNGFSVTSFLDNSHLLAGSEYQGVPVIRPQELFADSSRLGNSFILVASVDRKNKEIFEKCRMAGMCKGKDFINIQELSPYYPTIEVAGVCGLKCISCSYLRSLGQQNKTGFMSANVYAGVIKKLIKEIPFLYLVDLYIWGDPLLNPELPEIIRINRSLGIESGISTNLNNARYLEEVIKASPAQIRVSLSGFGPENYEVTHTGGNWDTLYNNLLELSRLIKEHETKTIVEIYYHVYKNNCAEAGKMRELCENLDFRFHPVLSMLFPDFAMDFCQGKGLTEEAAKANELMLLSIEKLVEDAAHDRNKRCLLNRVLPVINWDLSVMPCCNYAYHKLADNYLDTSLDEIIRLRTEHSLCLKCQEYSLHRYFNPEYYADITNAALASEPIHEIS